ncbi:hypothetical protein Tco_0412956 [Tanacetum coccineum]
MGLWYPKDSGFELIAYSDADHAGCKGAVDWKSSKQSTTVMSSTEAEYIAASEAAMEDVWIRKFISGLGIGSIDTPSVTLSALNDVYYIPSLTMSLASIYKICDYGSDVKFSERWGKLDAHDISDCSGCKLDKFLALPFSNSVSSSNAPFDLVHSCDNRDFVRLV